MTSMSLWLVASSLHADFFHLSFNTDPESFNTDTRLCTLPARYCTPLHASARTLHVTARLCTLLHASCTLLHASARLCTLLAVLARHCTPLHASHSHVTATVTCLKYPKRCTISKKKMVLVSTFKSLLFEGHFIYLIGPFEAFLPLLRISN